jgi:cysteinyl-tRNA synthetase
MLTLYNTLTRRVEPFEPIAPGLVTIYSCGPTVYRYVHIGNLRTFLMADWLKRTLGFLGFQVRHIKNITDVGHMRLELLDRGEDKLIAQARKEGKTSAEIAAFYTAAFLDDEARMNILPADLFPRATEHVADMMTIIRELERKGLAYAAGGNVYFDIAHFPEYGKLSGNLITQLLEGVSDTSDPLKRHPEDFALWKAAEPGREMAWESPWGRGFPGWHIECSAMSLKHLGARFDIHTGGVDNIFPHHEGEIAQSEGYTGSRCVNYWVHAQHLLADGLKMAKSTGNAYTLADVEARGFEPMALRLLFATVHYRSRINFTFSALRAAQTALTRLRDHMARLAAATCGSGKVDESLRLNPDLPASAPAGLWRERFTTAISYDLNLPQAVATLWDMLRGRGPETTPAERRALALEFDQVLGLKLAGLGDRETGRQGDTVTFGESEDAVPSQYVSPSVPESIHALVMERETFRRQGRYGEADALREQLRNAGYTIRDTHNGPIVALRLPEEEFGSISRPADVPDGRGLPDQYDVSVNLLAHDSRADLERCLRSIARHRAGVGLEVVIVDNGSTDDTPAYLRDLVRNGLHDDAGQPIPLTVLFADHNMGFAAGRNATLRASRGRQIVLLDTSIELRGNIWAPIATALANDQVGLAGTYGLVTDNLNEFRLDEGPDVDAVEGYLMAFRRALLPEIGWFEEKFRFYRLLDIYVSFMVKTSGYRVVTLPAVAGLLQQHPHREWYSLTEEERAIKSKKNFDIFKRRWHHGQSLIVANYIPEDRWFGHDHRNHLGAGHTHRADELPPPGQPHTHRHQHWPDHAHEHPHVHR